MADIYWYSIDVSDRRVCSSKMFWVISNDSFEEEEVEKVQG